MSLDTWGPHRGELWTSGRWSAELRADELADLHVDGVLVARSVRAVVRDRDWGTVPVAVTGLTEDAAGVALTLRYDGLGIAADAGATIEIDGHADGAVREINAVVACAAVDPVRARATRQHVVACIADQRVVMRGADDPFDTGDDVALGIAADAGATVEIGGDAVRRRRVIRNVGTVAPVEAVVTIRGSIKHANEKGDGVRARIVSDRGGVLGDWVAHDGREATGVERHRVAAGETIDFVADCRAEPSYDSFTWGPSIRLVENPGGLLVTSWDARDDFHGPLPPRLTRWQQYAQVLLLTNEFAYVD